jgi:hypothetical protein
MMEAYEAWKAVVLRLLPSSGIIVDDAIGGSGRKKKEATIPHYISFRRACF